MMIQPTTEGNVHQENTENQPMALPPKKPGSPKKAFRIILLFCGIILGLGAAVVYYLAFRPNIRVVDEPAYLFIPTGSRFEDVCRILEATSYLQDAGTFQWTARQKNYPDRVRPGRYRLREGMSNHSLINMLRSGRQEPVNVIVPQVRTREELASRIAKQIEAESLSLIGIFSDPDSLRPFGLDSISITSLFIPNTYQFYWNTSATEFLRRMDVEHRKFWNEDRQARAEQAGLSPKEVGVLASIIQSESNQKDELPRIAGVYLNRLRMGIKLEADPTVVYAHRDFSIRRVLKRHLDLDSPFNTYRYEGLPPGPIAIASIQAIEAVLHAEKHNYFFFCAREDFSGYHNFSRTLEEHLANARKYQRSLTQKRIMQ